MHLHILGISGTFMGGVALLAKQLGFQVTGSDKHIYPPMSQQLIINNIKTNEGFLPRHIDKSVDFVLVGNIIQRGNESIEFTLSEQIPYLSGPEWLHRFVLKDRCVLAVAGTHGKTTTSSLLAWILDHTGLNPGFLIGGIPENFGVSARLGTGKYFVIEADEYDTTFFDKRPKFLHYRPNILILNNLEFDHADIYPDIQAIQQQFHYLIRTVPGNGCLIHNQSDPNLKAVLAKGCWTPTKTFAGLDANWQSSLIVSDGSAFKVRYQNEEMGEVRWALLGQHNVNNALAALAAAYEVGVDMQQAIESLSKFKPVKRRMEIKWQKNDVTFYDDFAHHPTAIAATLNSLRQRVGSKSRLIAVLEFGSYTMRTGIHKSRLQEALKDADIVFCKNPKTDWGLQKILQTFPQKSYSYDCTDRLVNQLVNMLQPGDHIITMSSTAFDNIHQKIAKVLNKV